MSEVLSDAVVVVAGAGGGAGAAVVRHLAAAGATVVMADTSVERLDPVAEEVAATGGRAFGYAVNLLDEQATTSWANSVVDRFGRVDGVVHLVGGWRGGKGIVEADLADWDWLSDLLIRTVQHATRAYHDALRAAPAGRFVLVSAETRAMLGKALQLMHDGLSAHEAVAAVQADMAQREKSAAAFDALHAEKQAAPAPATAAPIRRSAPVGRSPRLTAL